MAAARRGVSATVRSEGTTASAGQRLITDAAQAAAASASRLHAIDAARDQLVNQSNAALSDVGLPAVVTEARNAVNLSIVRIGGRRERAELLWAEGRALASDPSGDLLAWLDENGKALIRDAAAITTPQNWIGRLSRMRKIPDLARRLEGVDRAGQRWMDAQEAAIRSTAARELDRLDEQFNDEQHAVGADFDRRTTEWRSLSGRLELAHPLWASSYWRGYAVPTELPQGVRVGTSRFTYGPFELAMPVIWPFPGGQSLCIASNGPPPHSLRAATLGIALRTLAGMPRGSVEVTFADPDGLGENVAPLMTLREYDGTIVTANVLTDDRDIEQALADFTSHITHVNASYLRGKYSTIEDHNRDAGEVAVPYKLFVAIGCPSRFNEKALERLSDVVETGGRAGVIAILLVDRSTKLPYGGDLGRIERACWTMEPGTTPTYDTTGRRSGERSAALVASRLSADVPVDVDQPPEFRVGGAAKDTVFGHVIDQIGSGARESRVRIVEFNDLLRRFRGDVERNPSLYVGTPPSPLVEDPSTWWQASTAAGLDVPIGLVGATKVQRFRVGGSMNHAVVVGANGTGKSTLLHCLISALCLTYPPSELTMTLIDMKNGVGFKLYGEGPALPHADTIAVSCDRSVALDVLDDLILQMRDRYELFKELTSRSGSATEGIAEYRERSGNPMPRHVCIIDEFHDLTAQDDAISLAANDRVRLLVKEARAAGIHLILATQNLLGCGLPKDAISEMSVRLCFRVEDATASEAALGEGNYGAVQDIPGEERGLAIYNVDRTKAGNELFKVSWIDRGSQLSRIVSDLRSKSGPTRISRVFDGDAPADLVRDPVVLSALGLAASAPATGLSTGMRTRGARTHPSTSAGVTTMKTRGKPGADSVPSAALDAGPIVRIRMGRGPRGEVDATRAEPPVSAASLTPPPLDFGKAVVGPDGEFVLDAPDIPAGGVPATPDAVLTSPRSRRALFGRRGTEVRREFGGFLGQPMKLRPTLEAPFARATSRNVLIVGTDDGQTLGLIDGIAVGAVAGVRGSVDGESGPIVTLLDGGTSEGVTQHLQRLAEASDGLFVFAMLGDVEDLVLDLHAEVVEREHNRGDSTPLPHLMILHGVQNAAVLRVETSFGDDKLAAGAAFRDVLGRGPSVGVHVVCVADAPRAVRRVFQGGELDDFGLRVVARLGQADLQWLLDVGRMQELPPQRAAFRGPADGIDIFLPYAPLTDFDFVRRAAVAARG